MAGKTNAVIVKKIASVFICHLALAVCCHLCVVYVYFRFGCHHSNTIVAITLALITKKLNMTMQKFS